MTDAHRLSDLLGEFREADSMNWAFCCPFCLKRIGEEDDSYKLIIHKENEKWQCWKCGAKGLKVLHLYTRLGETPAFGLGNFADNLHDLLYPATDTTEQEAEVGELILPDRVVNIVPGSPPHQYLQSREITDHQIAYYGIKDCDVMYGGKVVRSIWYPCYLDGKLTFYQTRSLEGKFIRNAKGLKKNQHVGNINHPYKWSIICEGPTSAIRAGYNALWTFGKAISDIQLDMICEREDEVIYCALESDFIHKNIELAQRLRNRGKKPMVVTLPLDKDPADMPIERFHKLLKQAVSLDDSFVNQLKCKLITVPIDIEI